MGSSGQDNEGWRRAPLADIGATGEGRRWGRWKAAVIGAQSDDAGPRPHSRQAKVKEKLNDFDMAWLLGKNFSDSGSDRYSMVDRLPSNLW